MGNDLTQAMAELKGFAKTSTESNGEIKEERRGGARQNSGPEKGAKYTKTLEKEALQKTVKEFVSSNLTPILNHLLQAVQEGDTAAAKLLLEYGLGKPKLTFDDEDKPIALIIDI